jgi:hypothetical protein
VNILNKLKGIDYFSQIISTDHNNYILMDLNSEFSLLDLIKVSKGDMKYEIKAILIR